MARAFWCEPAKRGRVTGVSATPNAQPIAFQQVVPEYFRTFIRLFRVKKLLALLLALWICEFVTPCPNMAWSWRRGSESNRRMQLLQSRALPLGYPATASSSSTSVRQHSDLWQPDPPRRWRPHRIHFRNQPDWRITER